MSVQIQLRRGTAAEWTTANTLLSSGEVGYETDTGKLKVGNGTDTWSTLAYLVGQSQASSVVYDNTTTLGAYGDGYNGSSTDIQNAVDQLTTLIHDVDSEVSTRQVAGAPIAATTITVDEANLNTIFPGTFDGSENLNTILTVLGQKTADVSNSKLSSVVAGTNVTVDSTDPLNPIISATGGGGGGGGGSGEFTNVQTINFVSTDLLFGVYVLAPLDTTTYTHFKIVFDWSIDYPRNTTASFQFGNTTAINPNNDFFYAGVGMNTNNTMVNEYGGVVSHYEMKCGNSSFGRLYGTIDIEYHPSSKSITGSLRGGGLNTPNNSNGFSNISFMYKNAAAATIDTLYITPDNNGGGHPTGIITVYSGA